MERVLARGGVGRAELPFASRWVLACALAELVGIGTAAGVAVMVRRTIGESAGAGRWLALAALAAGGSSRRPASTRARAR